MVRQISLSQSKTALVDDEDYGLLILLANSSRGSQWRYTSKLKKENYYQPKRI